MDTLEIYLARLQTLRDGIKFTVGMETMPVKLEQKMLYLLLEITREIERTKRAIKALAGATPAAFDSDDNLIDIDATLQTGFPVGASETAGSDMPPTVDDLAGDKLPPVDKTGHKKTR